MDANKKRQELKKGMSADASRRRRGEAAIQLRKSQKEEGIAKRRNLAVAGDNEDEDYEILDQPDAPGVPPSQSKTAIKPSTDLRSFVNDLRSPDPAVQLVAVKAFRRALSVEKNPPVQLCIDIGAVGLFVHLLQRIDCPELQFEASWALTNIASTEHTAVVADHGAIPHLVKLLTSNVPDVREQSAWCLGNISGDGPRLRDLVLQSGALGPLIANIAEPASISLLRNCTWSLSNFCRGKPQPDLNVILPAVQALGMLLRATSDLETMADVGWALSYVSDGDNDRIEAVVSQGVVPKLVDMLLSNRTELIVPALRTLGNIVTGTDAQTQLVLDTPNMLTGINKVLGHTKKNIRKEACWLLSNVAAGSRSQISQLICTSSLVQSVLNQMSDSTEWDVRKEASWVICNIASGGSKEQIHQIVEYGCIRSLCDLLSVGDAKVLMLAMEAIENVLKAGMSNASVNYPQLIDSADGIDKLEMLQEHESNDVYKKAVHIIEKYFSGEEEVSENVAPVNNGGMFGFGLAPSASGEVSKPYTSFLSSSSEPQPAHAFAAFGSNSAPTINNFVYGM
jgi:hypothetical protein